MKKKDVLHGTRSLPLGVDESENFFIRLFSNQKFIALIALGILILLFFPLAKSYSRRLVVEKEIAEMKNKIAEYEKESNELQDFLNYLSSPEAAEEQARLSLNMKKPGEGVVVIETINKTSDLEDKNTDLKNEKNIKKWLNYFFN
jgi:cell division protein FtsB